MPRPRPRPRQESPAPPPLEEKGPRSEYGVATVFSAQVRSNDGKAIVVEAGGFTPMRWFLERAIHTNDDEAAEPPKKKRKVQQNGNHYASALPKKAEQIPLFKVAIDFHFPDSAQSTAATEEAIASDVDFSGTVEVPVVPYGIEVDGDGTNLRISFPQSNKPILVMECGPLEKDLLELLRHVARPGHLKTATANTRKQQHPASQVSCTLSQSRGELHTVVRLTALLSWTDGSSAFAAGAPVGAEKVYPDYDLLLQAYEDHARESVDHSQPWSPQDFYESVHAPSTNEPTEGLYRNVLESDLYPFQKRAVTWLLDREDTHQEAEKPPSPSFYVPVKDVNGHDCHVNHLQGIIARSAPDNEDMQLRGGLLAEEMGLGKTVEVMALIALHQRSEKNNVKVFDEHSGSQVTKSKATLIITPATILQQWQSELRRHAPMLSVYHYQGIPTGSKKPTQSEKSLIQELANNYDVVLATYHTLAREVHFAEDPPERNMRQKRKFDRKRSPLVQLEWWRICLDEAQMVESGVTAAARVACRLPRVHSWAVSGTPLRKNVQDLHGLLIFLRYRPFSTDGNLWGHLVQNHRHLFKRIFGQIALRHTKAQVREELHLPPQKRVVVTVPFSVIEQQNYTNLFNQMCEDVGLNAEGAPQNEDWDPDDSGTIEKMRSWLVRLRQTCLHPQVGGKNRRALGRGAGALRTVNEVLQIMIEQNETNLRVEERAFVTASLIRAHILGNNGEDERRAEKALAIYEEAASLTENMVKDAREQLAMAKAAELEKGETVAGTDDEEDESSTESTPILGRLRANLRIALQLHHTCIFFAATACFQIKDNDALTMEGSDRFKELEARESSLYETAKILRKERLRDTARKAESLMSKIQDWTSKKELTKMPPLRDLESLGGIESRRIVEKGDELFNVIREQVVTIKDLRAKIAEFLVKPLVDDEKEGIETTGEEYENSTKEQDELYVYFDAIKAMHADLNTFITGEGAPLIDHEVKTLVRDAKWVLNPEIEEDQKPTGVHAPELALKLFAVRNKHRARRDEVGTVRSLIQEARALETSTQWNQTGSRASAEHAIVGRHLASLQAVFTAYSKALTGLEKEVDVFRTTQNHRVEFYRQLQEVSDDVAPYKDELDDHLDQHALGVAIHKEEQAANVVKQLKTKNRFLLHLKDESGAQSGQKICIICTSSFERGVLTVCGHQFCKDCMNAWLSQSKTCPMCKRHLTKHDLHDITYKPQELRAQEEVHSAESSPSKDSNSAVSTQTSLYTDVDSKLMDEIKSIDLPSSYGTKIDTLARHLHWIREHDPGAKSIVFSQYREFLDVLGGALKEFKLGYARLGRQGAVEKFRNDAAIDCLLLDAKTDSSGLTLVNATHVFVCEPLIQTAVELQAIARVHRIGQTRPTTVWMYLINDTVEEAIYEISVARRLEHVKSRQQSKRSEKSRSSTPAPLLQENAIDAANSEELQSAPLTKLLVAGKGGGEMVGNEDLWRCLFGKANKSAPSEALQREVGRHLRAEAAEERRVGEASASAGAMRDD